MRRVVLSIVGALVGLLSFVTPPLARADVYEGSIMPPAPAQPPSFTPEAPITQQEPYLHSFSVTYDDGAGTIKIAFGYYEPNYWAPRFEPAAGPESVEGLRVGQEFGFDVWLSEEEAVSNQLEKGSTIVHIGKPRVGSEGLRASLDLLGYNGTLSSPVTYSAGLYTLLFAHPALIGLHLKSFGINDQDRPQERELKLSALRDISGHPTVTRNPSHCGHGLVSLRLGGKARCLRSCRSVRGGALYKTLALGVSCQVAQRVWHHFASSGGPRTRLPSGWRCSSRIIGFEESMTSCSRGSARLRFYES